MAQAFWRDLWTVLNTDIQDLGLLSWDTAETAIEGASSLIDLAATLNENRTALPQLAPVLDAAAPLIEALDSPLAAVVGGLLPFGTLSIGILKACLQSLQKDPTLSDCVTIVAQATYFQSLQDILARLEDTDTLKPILGTLKLKTLMSAQSQALQALKLNNDAAKKTVTCFHTSPLASVLGKALQAQLPDTTATAILLDRVARNTHWFLYQALAEAGEGVEPLAELFRNGGAEKLEQEASIRRYLETEIATQPGKQVFNEAQADKVLSFADLYVPMKARHINDQGNVVDADPFDLETWATESLNNPDPQHQNQVLFVQGEPGYGKSVFCRLYADWVRRHLYPSWIPILIRLRDVELQPQWRETLRQAVNCDFAANDKGWLTDTNTRFLFLLDGFDELILSQREGQGLKAFLDNVARFQRDCAKYPEEQGHRVLITGRPMALQGHEYSLPNSLNRVAIQPLDDDLQAQWLAHWQAYTGKENTEKLRRLLQAPNCPQELQTLAREPLLLYLLAVLARSDELKPDLFEETQGIAIKIQIYTRLIDFVLAQQRTHPETGENLNQTLTGLKPKQLRRVLADLALGITQTETERASVAALKQRIPEKAEQELDDLAKQNILASFYLKPATSSGSIEFIHKSFREFLTAERLQRSLKAWTEVRQDDYDEETPIVANDQFEQQIYDLLGYGSLTKEIVDYLLGLLQQQPNLDWGRLAQRLQRFYFRWADGVFIEQTTETLPQKKAGQLQKQGIQKGQRQVDIYTGLNVLILLFELHRYGKTLDDSALKTQLAFHPCGKKRTDRWNSSRLLRVIHYSSCLGSSSFNRLLGQFLIDTDLSRANLSGVEFYGANLRRANLRRARLFHTSLVVADLRSADLRSANLHSAKLNGAKLIDADLGSADPSSSTNLSSADLSSADLSNADLRGTNLSQANLNSAKLVGAKLYLADLSSTDLRSAKLRLADLRTTKFEGANLRDANLSGANLSRANLSDANLSRASLFLAQCFKANLENIHWDARSCWDSVYNLHTTLKIQDRLAQDLSFSSAFILSQGYALAQSGDIDAALQAYDKAQQMNPTLFVDVCYWQQLCWYGCLYGQPAQVLFAGERAVQLLEDREEISCLESRGIARAMTNNLMGALVDFQAAQGARKFLSIANDRRKWSEAQQQRQRWIAALEAGQNPFTPEELARLRAEASGEVP